MLSFTIGDFEPLVTLIEVLVATYFMVADYGGDLKNINFAKRVVEHVANILSTEEISFDMQTQLHLRPDEDKSSDCYGFWPISSSVPPMAVRP
jgi:hypothetical protein